MRERSEGERVKRWEGGRVERWEGEGVKMDIIPTLLPSNLHTLQPQNEFRIICYIQVKQ